MTRKVCLSWLVLALACAVVPPALADSFLVFTEGGIPANGSDIWTWCDAGQPCDVREVQECDTPEGSHNMRTNTNLWAGWGVFFDIDEFNTPQPRDLSAFADGDLRFFVKTPFDLKVEMQCRPDVSDVTKTTFIAQHGWDGTNTWQEIVIPIASFFDPDPVDMQCVSNVIAPYMGTIADLPFFNTFRVDNVRWHLPNDHSGPSSVEVQGRQLLVDGEPFVVNGMAYAPISICEDYHGAFQGDRSDRYDIDFPLIAGSGANAIRLYSTFMTTAMLDAAWAQGLYVIPTFGIDWFQLTCPEGKEYMQDRFREDVQEWSDHPAILFWLVGNEVNANLGSADLCADWFPQLDTMAKVGTCSTTTTTTCTEDTDCPGSETCVSSVVHPVGTASADLGGVCVADCSDDTSLPNVDLWGAQVYRGCDLLDSAFTEYQAKSDCARPLIITEFGADAWDSLLGAESETLQADCLETMLDDADQNLAVRTANGVSSGQVIFEWADEWWKAYVPDPPEAGFCTATDWCLHDSCKNWENSNYPDPAMNEEWWGITSLSATDPDARGLRAAHGRVNASWYLSAVGNLEVVSHDPGTGDTTISFDPGAGSTDHTLYYGPLSAVSSYGYSGSVSGLGADGSSSVTLPAGSLFWVVVGRNNGAEGCYGKDYPACNERPPSPGSSLPQTANRTCSVPECP